MNECDSAEAYQVLLVEDNPGDAGLVRQYFKRSTYRTTLHWVEDAEQALAFLKQQDPYRESRRPHLVLMDLNLPGRSGEELLAQIKADAVLRPIPVVAFTSADVEDDIRHVYHLHANCCLVKPLTLERLTGMLASLERFWFTIARLPPMEH